MKRELEEWLKAQCNRYVNGQCTTRGCLVRGGYEPGTTPVDYSLATCEPHELLTTLSDLEQQDRLKTVEINTLVAEVNRLRPLAKLDAPL